MRTKRESKKLNSGQSLYRHDVSNYGVVLPGRLWLIKPYRGLGKEGVTEVHWGGEGG